MIDPHTGDRASCDQLEKKLMGRIKHFRQLHPDRGEIVHVEEAPVVDLLRRDPPKREAV
jgi:hypothetical protein